MMSRAYKAIENGLSDSFCSKNDTNHKVVLFQIHTRGIFKLFHYDEIFEIQSDSIYLYDFQSKEYRFHNQYQMPQIQPVLQIVFPFQLSSHLFLRRVSKSKLYLGLPHAKDPKNSL